ncbi:hypothetical protein GQ53DRAFT_306369 [Thozetella sp. PMI_491]|nr:hypothetical protein GQ53DRAFT_306369 [Thozetella sp. PMI_491]
MEHTKALSALEPFLALTKSATSPRAAADLITRATSAPNTFVFTELLQAQQIQALASSAEFTAYLTLLQIFSYGTYSSYQKATGLPSLNDAQTLKLRQLSLLTLAGTGTAEAHGYAALIDGLGLSSHRDLEDLVVSAVYAGLVNAQLDPKNQTVLFNSVAALRDVAPGAIGGLLTSLQAWADRCDATLASLEAQIADVRLAADRRAAESEAWKQRIDKLAEDETKVSEAARRAIS